MTTLSAEVAEAYDPKVTAALIRIYERETAELARLGTRRHLGENVMNQLRAAAAEIERLFAELEQARADGERINWLEQHPRFSEVHVNGRIENGYLYGVAGASGFKLREIIDAARAKESP